MRFLSDLRARSAAMMVQMAIPVIPRSFGVFLETLVSQKMLTETHIEVARKC